jgi:alkylhydroperoxidase family enzyme
VTQTPLAPPDTASWEELAGTARPWAALRPEATAALDAAYPAVWRSVVPGLLDLCRQRIAMLLALPAPSAPPGLPASHADKVGALADWPGSPLFSTGERAALAFTEQFVMDVSRMTEGLRDGLRAACGDQTEAFAKALYVVDLSLRLDFLLPALFAADGPVVPAAPAVDPQAPRVDAWPEVQVLHRAAGRMHRIDPLTVELSRLRVAATHNCRICLSRRNLSALEAADDPGVLDMVEDYERSALAERHKVALRLTDAYLTMPSLCDDALIRAVREHFSPVEALELLHRDARNASNKYAVSLGTETPPATEGIELFDVDEAGTVVAALDADDLRRVLAERSS